jgi:hypothetical protein
LVVLAVGKPGRRGNAAARAQTLENPVSTGFALTTMDCGAGAKLGETSSHMRAFSEIGG